MAFASSSLITYSAYKVPLWERAIAILAQSILPIITINTTVATINIMALSVAFTLYSSMILEYAFPKAMLKKVIIILPNQTAKKNLIKGYLATPSGTYSTSSGRGRAANKNTATNIPLWAILENNSKFFLTFSGKSSEVPTPVK